MSRTYFEISLFGCSLYSFNVKELTFEAIDKASKAVGYVMSDAHINRLVAGETTVTLWARNGRNTERAGSIQDCTSSFKYHQALRIKAKLFANGLPSVTTMVSCPRRFMLVNDAALAKLA